MMVNLFEDNTRISLRPLTFTRPVADLRVGIMTIAEKWNTYTNTIAGFDTVDYLSVKYPLNPHTAIFINGSVCPDPELFAAIIAIREGEVLKNGDTLLAFKCTEQLSPEQAAGLRPVEYPSGFTRIVFPEDIFKYNDTELRKDFKLLTKGRVSAALSETNTILGDDIFVEEGAVAECSTFNTLTGPVFLGKNSEVWEGCHIRGSFALGEESQLKMGAKVYGQTTIGPFSRVGGEINNAIIWGYSSKGHEGYLGNAVMGQWCNIGADSNNSNLKNNYGEVKLWDYQRQEFRQTGLQFCGLIMADHAKCGINTMFNTGTVAGVSANVFGAGYPRNFIPDFAWGGAQGFEVYQLDKMFETTEKVFERRNMIFDQIEKDILTRVFDLTAPYRHF
jgi:UDP-N-acetylglucosamine diphosphorylase/glucosamine-1-phosphate N-acetyltransferase